MTDVKILTDEELAQYADLVAKGVYQPDGGVAHLLATITERTRERDDWHSCASSLSADVTMFGQKLDAAEAQVAALTKALKSAEAILSALDIWINTEIGSCAFPKTVRKVQADIVAVRNGCRTALQPFVDALRRGE